MRAAAEHLLDRVMCVHRAEVQVGSAGSTKLTWRVHLTQARLRLEPLRGASGGGVRPMFRRRYRAFVPRRYDVSVGDRLMDGDTPLRVASVEDAGPGRWLRTLIVEEVSP